MLVKSNETNIKIGKLYIKNSIFFILFTTEVRIVLNMKSGDYSIYYQSY